MSDPFKSRSIAAHLVVRGNLELVTPAHLGNGDAESITAMPLLRDRVTGHPLLTGTSIAGALRGYLHSYERGYGRRPENGRDNATLAVRLFGSLKGDDQGEQSPLIVDDARGTFPADGRIEVRDGVKIDYGTRTADDKKKYDLELLPAGTTFRLRFTLLLPANEDRAQELRLALALALHGLMADTRGYGAMTLGARRSRGFGRCRVAQWQLQHYNLRDTEGLLAWLAANHADWGLRPTAVWTGAAAAVLGENVALPEDRIQDARRRFQIHAVFDLDSAILVRATDPLTATGEQPDVAHLRSYRPEDPRRTVPILPGTSLAGALRGRATRILNTLWMPSSPQSEALLDTMFGIDMHRERRHDKQETPTASRLIVEETPITGGQPLVQNRVAIDRFTGGAYDTALFAEAPQIGGDVALRLTLRLDALSDDKQTRDAQTHFQQAQIGLLLLLLKDLWTGDLPLGGTSSIGRGRLRGRWAELTADTGDVWCLKVRGNTSDSEAQRTQITVAPDSTRLEDYVRALYKYLKEEQA
jgi:CRISPR/Cas system CSM-associated protein Csm3 (group 7 of RAMP superfamily)